MTETITPLIGMVLYGYCQGYFGRDSYEDKRIEAIGIDYIVVRASNNEVSLLDTKDWNGQIPKAFIEEEYYD